MRSGYRVPGADRLVIDASAAVRAALIEDGFAIFRSQGALVAPTLVWSEVASAVSQLRWRGELDDDEAGATLRRFLGAPIDAYPSRDLIEEATALARRLGWAKTYDAEYVTLAIRLEAPLVTVDRRLREHVSSIVTVLGPLDLPG